ncbi:MAG: hypothetical protein PVH12_03025 [Candidatus Bathyarchaeota archaeon]|jgi:hypothetical protein
MDTEQEVHGDVQYAEDTYVDEAELQVSTEQDQEPREYIIIEPETEQASVLRKRESLPDLVQINEEKDRSGFIHGLSVGLGVGCIATFIIMWIAVFFSPQLPSTVTYEALLSIFIYPLIYLLSVGLIALTAGVALEYYKKNSNY